VLGSLCREVAVEILDREPGMLPLHRDKGRPLLRRDAGPSRPALPLSPRWNEAPTRPRARALPERGARPFRGGGCHGVPVDRHRVARRAICETWSLRDPCGNLHPRGDPFDAVIPRLEALRDLGITAIELDAGGELSRARTWGYDGVACSPPRRTYGGPAGLHASGGMPCHAHDLAVILETCLQPPRPRGELPGRVWPLLQPTGTRPPGERR